MRPLLFLAGIISSLPAHTQVRLAANALNETSGIVQSALQANVLFVHNDSGDTSRFFAIDNKGALLTTYYFKGMGKKRGVQDCEDIAAGEGPAKGKTYIYLGDIGDNHARRPLITIYRFQEPVAGKTTTARLKAAPLFLKYPDGPRDAETLMADNRERLLYIVSKREDSVHVYTTPMDYRTGDTVLLTKRATLFFPGFRPLKWITAGDISPDGDRVLMKSYAKVYYWKRRKGEALWQTLQRPPAELPYRPEPQGEAIGFDNTGKGYYTTSEGLHPVLYHYGIRTP